MPSHIFINLPVADLNAAKKFYQKLGFKLNPQFTNNVAACMNWSEEIVVMLLDKSFYKLFIDGKRIADARKTSSVLLALDFDSRKAVDKFVKAGRDHGGRVYKVEIPGAGDSMYGALVEDLDGHVWEALYMDMSEVPEQPADVPQPLPKISQPAMRALASIGVTNANQLKDHTRVRTVKTARFRPADDPHPQRCRHPTETVVSRKEKHHAKTNQPPFMVCE